MTDKQMEARIGGIILTILFVTALVAMFTSENAVDRNIGDDDGTTLAY